jgi:HEAT repeat protein
MKRPAPGGGFNYDLQQLISAVAGFQSLKAGKAILRVVAEGDAQSSRCAAQSLYRFRSRELGPEIIAYLEKAPEAGPSDGDPPQRHLISVLQNMQETRAGAVMVKLLGSPNQNVRQAAAGALSTLADAQSVPALAKAFESGQAPGGRPMASQEMVYIAQALERLGDGRACKALLAQVGNANQQVAYAAARGLARCVDFECTADLVKAHSACGDNSVKSFLKAALSSGLYPARWIENDQAFVVDAERLDWLRKNKDKLEPARERDKAQENF